MNITFQHVITPRMRYFLTDRDIDFGGGIRIYFTYHKHIPDELKIFFTRDGNTLSPLDGLYLYFLGEEDEAGVSSYECI